MPDALAGDSKLGVGADEVAPGVHQLGAGELALYAPEAGAAPTSEQGALSHLSDRLERDELDAADQQRFVAASEC
jgi:hypothetical protein